MPLEHLGSRSLGGSLAGTRSRAKRKTNGPNGSDRGSEKSGCARTSENILGQNCRRTWPVKKPDSRGVARVAVPAIWLFTTLTLVATILHFGKFHFSSSVASAQGAAWFWLAIYVGVPVVMLLIGWLQIRTPGGDPPRGSPAAIWMRALVLGQGAGMLAFGVGLFAIPDIIAPSWPWTLTTLTARAIGAWLIGIGVAALHANRENDVSR